MMLLAARTWLALALLVSIQSGSHAAENPALSDLRKQVDELRRTSQQAADDWQHR